MGNYLFSSATAEQPRETSQALMDTDGRYEQTDEEYNLRLYKYECRVYESTHHTLSKIVKGLPDGKHMSKIRDIVETLNMMMYTNIYEAKDTLYITPPENDNALYGTYLERIDALQDRYLSGGVAEE